MSVIVFKKKVQDDEYMDALLKHNFTPIFIPVLEHRLDNIQLIKTILYNGPKREEITGLIVTSQRSVEAIEACIKDTLEENIIDEWNALPKYVVGAQTAKALSSIPLFENTQDCNWIVKPKALDLIKYIPKDDKQNFLFLAGDKRRDVIPQTLEEHHVRYREIQSYSTHIHPELHLNLQRLHDERVPIEWIALFSPSGLEFIKTAIHDNTELLNYYFSNTIKVASIGPTTTDAIKQFLFNPNLTIVTAEKPDAKHLVKAMIE